MIVFSFDHKNNQTFVCIYIFHSKLTRGIRKSRIIPLCICHVFQILLCGIICETGIYSINVEKWGGREGEGEEVLLDKILFYLNYKKIKKALTKTCRWRFVLSLLVNNLIKILCLLVCE